MYKDIIFISVLILLMFLGLLFLTSETFCKYVAERNFQKRIRADGRYEQITKKLDMLQRMASEKEKGELKK